MTRSKKLSVSAKRQWANPVMRRVLIKRLRIGSKARWSKTSEHKRMSAASKIRWEDPAYRKKITEWARRVGHRPRPSLGARKLKRILGRGWKLEYRVRGLRRMPIDIAHPGMKLAIEVDGKSHDRSVQKLWDRDKDTVLRKFGWSIFRVSEEGCRCL